MNTRIKIISIAIVIGICCTACSTTTTNSTQGSSLNTESSNNTVSQKTNADSDVTGLKSFYGTWKVKSCIGTSASYALSEDEINSLIGTTITYGSDVFKNGDTKISVSKYEEEHETADQFYENFGIHLTDIEITEDNVNDVFIGVEGEFFGDNFYIKDSNTLVIYYVGVFFEAIRAWSVKCLESLLSKPGQPDIQHLKVYWFDNYFY